MHKIYNLYNKNDYTKELFKELAIIDAIDFNQLPADLILDESFKEQYEEFYNEDTISDKLDCETIPMEILLKYKDIVDWKDITSIRDPGNEILKQLAEDPNIRNDLDWEAIFTWNNIDDEIIDKYADMYNDKYNSSWVGLSKNKNMTVSRLEKYADKIDWSVVCYDRIDDIPFNIIEKYKDKLDDDAISVNNVITRRNIPLNFIMDGIDNGIFTLKTAIRNIPVITLKFMNWYDDDIMTSINLKMEVASRYKYMEKDAYEKYENMIKPYM